MDEAVEEALKSWGKGEQARRDAVTTYNARREVVWVERAGGNWSGKLDAEWNAMKRTEQAEYALRYALFAALSPVLRGLGEEQAPGEVESAIHDLREAVLGRPKSEADAKAREVLRSLSGDAPLAGDQAVAFLALRAYFGG